MAIFSLSQFRRSSLQPGNLVRLMPFLVAAILSAPGTFAQNTGYWHTSGAQIVDGSNKPVRISGVNWYGFETSDQVVHGLYEQDYIAILRDIRALGYNTIRLPYSNQMVERPIVPSSIAYSNGGGAINTSLRGLNSLQVMDKVVQAASGLGLKVILDNHRSEAGNGTEANGLWYTSAYPERNWIADWQTLVKRYASVTDSNGNPTVIGVDLRNEPHLSANGGNSGSCWTGDTAVKGCPSNNAAQNWPAAAARAGNAVLAMNPKLLIFVEGVDCFDGDCDFWGGNLEGAKNNPVQLSVASRLVYSPHDYGPREYQQKWFNSSTTPVSLDAIWTKFWGYLCSNGTAPVWLGEFGTTNSVADAESTSPGSQGQWFSSLIAYLGNHPTMNWTYWALNGEDSYGLLDNNYGPTPPSSLKQQLLSSIQSATQVSNGCGATPAAPAALKATVPSSSQINLSWSAVTPPKNCSVSYSVFRGNSSSFTPSPASRIAASLSNASFSDAGLSSATTYYYIVQATDSFGASTASVATGAKTLSNSASPFSCHVDYSVTNQWAGGFQAAVTITNTSAVDINAWTLKWVFPGNQQIASLWNAAFTQSANAVTATNETYDGAVAAGQRSQTVGFTANYSGANAAPTGFTVNGVSCR